MIFLSEYRRKQTIATIRLFKTDIDSLLLLPAEQFKISFEIISDEFDKINQRDAKRGNFPTEESLPPELSRAAKKIIINVIRNLHSDIDDYWRKAAVNAANRAKAGLKTK